MKPATFTSPRELLAAMGTNIRPLTVHWEDLYLANGFGRIRWSITVASCADLATLTAEWGGKRADRPAYHGTRSMYADIGDQGLVQHCCHTGLPCWRTT